MEKLALQPGPLSMKMYCAIGMVAVAWANLDEMVALCLSRLLGVDHVDFLAVSSNLQTRGRLDSLKALINQKLGEEQAPAFLALCDQAAELGRERNKVLHGAWVQTSNPDVCRRLTYRAHRRISADAPEISARQIAAMADAINGVSDRFVETLEQLGLYDRASPMRAPARPAAPSL